MTFQNIKYAIAVADFGSFSAAAKAMYISQSTLSMSIRELEEELDVQLFIRTSRGVVLTTDGEDFLRYARDIVERADDLEQRYRYRNYLPTRFAVSSQHLPYAVRAFNRLLQVIPWDSYDVAIRECPTYTVIEDVASGRSDLGVLALHDQFLPALERIFAANHVRFQEMELLPVYAFVRQNHPLSGKSVVTMDELLHYPFVTYDQEKHRSEYTEEIIFHQIADKNIHVCDRSTKNALIRYTNGFTLGPDPTNNVADRFHGEGRNVIALPVEGVNSVLHAGYLLSLIHI